MSLIVEHYNKESFIYLLNYFIEQITVSGVYSSSRSRERSDILEPPDIHPRFDLVLNGRKHMKFPGTDALQDIVMHPGDVHFCPPHTWKCPVWDYPHELSSLVYIGGYIRITYINFTGHSNWNNQRPADVFYHTATPLNEPEKDILDSLSSLPENTPIEIKRLLIDALIRLTLEHLKNDNGRNMTKADATWERINLFLQANFHQRISRNTVAEAVNVNPCYISKLFSERAKETFNDRLRRLKMEYAAKLLLNTDLTLDEITLRCGYQSTPSMVSIFKKLYKTTPGEFRRKKNLEV